MFHRLIYFSPNYAEPRPYKYLFIHPFYRAVPIKFYEMTGSTVGHPSNLNLPTNSADQGGHTGPYGVQFLPSKHYFSNELAGISKGLYANTSNKKDDQVLEKCSRLHGDSCGNMISVAREHWYIVWIVQTWMYDTPVCNKWQAAAK